MTYPSHPVVSSGQGRNKPARRTAWLKTTIVSASIVATLAGTQGIAWRESRNALAAIAGATPSASAVALAYPTAASLAAAPPAEQPAGTNDAGISLLALLPTPTPAPELAAVASVTPTDPPAPTPTVAPTPEPTATSAAVIASAPVQSQTGSAARPLARSRPSR